MVNRQDQLPCVFDPDFFPEPVGQQNCSIFSIDSMAKDSSFWFLSAHGSGLAEKPVMLLDAVMTKAVLLIPYYGSFPKWFDLFLLTSSRNPDFRFIIYTDKIPGCARYENVEWRELGLDQLTRRISKAVGVDIPPLANGYKLCDFKPAYGEIFADDLQDVPYWGHADTDIIWGRLDRFVGPALKHDVISGQKHGVCGPFTLYANRPEIAALYKSAPGFAEALASPGNTNFDEAGFSRHVMASSLKTYHLRHGHSESRSPHIYRDGKIITSWWRERPFFHFRTWKEGMRFAFDPAAVRGWSLDANELAPII